MVFALHSTARDPLAPARVQANGTFETVRSRRHCGIPQRSTGHSATCGLQEPRWRVGARPVVPASKQFEREATSGAVLSWRPQRQMLLGWHPMGAYTHMYAMNQFLASRGYVVLSVNFRGGTGYGMNFREPDEFAAGGGSEARDIAGAVDVPEESPGHRRQAHRRLWHELRRRDDFTCAGSLSAMILRWVSISQVCTTGRPSSRN